MHETHEAPSWATAALEEYKAHRAAILDTQTAGHQTLALGVTAVGVLVAGAFNVWDSKDALPATALFLVVIPTVSVLVLVQGSGLMLFVVQRGIYLRSIEHALRDAYGAPAKLFTWEDEFDERYRVRKERWKPALRWHKHATTFMFVLLAVGSIGLGVYKGFDSSPEVVAGIAGVELLVLTYVGWLLALQLAAGEHLAADTTTNVVPSSSKPRRARP
jgi:hypothetical protein